MREEYDFTKLNARKNPYAKMLKGNGPVVTVIKSQPEQPIEIKTLHDKDNEKSES